MNPSKIVDLMTIRNLPGMATLDMVMRVWDERPHLAVHSNFSRPVAINTRPCVGGTLEEDRWSTICKHPNNSTRPEQFRVDLAEFSVDLGRLGQEREDAPPVAAWLQVQGVGFSLTDAIRDPEVADVGAVEEDSGRPDEVEGVPTGAEWARRALVAGERRVAVEAFETHTEPDLTMPNIFNDTLDPTRATMGINEAAYAPPKYAPGWAPPRRFVHVWKRLLEVQPHTPAVVAKFALHSLRSGASAVVMYATPQAAIALARDPVIDGLLHSGRFVIVRWEGLAVPVGILSRDYDQLYYVAHATLSLWGRNVVIFSSDVDEMLWLPSKDEGPGSEKRPARRRAEQRAAARIARTAAARACRRGRVGTTLFSNVGETRLLRRRLAGLPLCSPGDGLPPPTPRQRRIADIMAFGGCQHEVERAVARRAKGPLFGDVLRSPKCGHVHGNPIHFNESAGAASAPDGLRIADAASPLEAFSAPSSTSMSWNWRKPLFLPDNSFSVYVHWTHSCEVARSQPWGRPAEGGYGAPLPLERLANGTWDLAAVGVPLTLSNNGTRPPPVQSSCRIVRTCEDVPTKCVAIWHYINLFEPRREFWESRVKEPWAPPPLDWLWVWKTKNTEAETELEAARSSSEWW